MKTKSRINSILKSSSLDHTITGIQNFNLAGLSLDKEIQAKLPSNLRLGHLVEKIVSELIKASTNFKLLYENIQIIEQKRTIGELDFIIQDLKADKLLHVELAYKFYLYDPNISSLEIENWIGPNRNDSLKEKLEKLKTKQFPLRNHQSTSEKLHNIEVKDVGQALCFLVSLFVPLNFKKKLNPVFEKAIKGYYINYEEFNNLDNSSKQYYIPQKKEWGISPSENKHWTGFTGVKHEIINSIDKKQAPLCWQKHNNTYIAFFIVWW